LPSRLSDDGVISRGRLCTFKPKKTGSGKDTYLSESLVGVLELDGIAQDDMVQEHGPLVI
jgi:hypothetical protein